MHVRCPHCHNPIEMVNDSPLEALVCPSCGSSFSLVAATETISQLGQAGRMLAHFELLEQLGVGAFGSVWKARDSKLDRFVAIKIPRPGQVDGEESEKLLRDARAAAQLRHPNIVGVHEVGRENGALYLVSDFIDGPTLADWLTGKKPTVREAAEMVVTIAQALHHAHQAGVVHRDLKPSNIMLDAAGKPHLIDFGLAKREAGEVTMTQEGQVLGTPAYMSPEQARGECHQADRRSDVYSLGVILFELLTGERPFRGNARMLIHQVLWDEAPGPRKLNAAVPRDVETICLKCLEKDRARRYRTANELAEELRRFLKHQPIHARPISRLERAWRWSRREPVVSSLTAAFITTVLIALFTTTVLWLQATSANNRAIKAGALEISSRDVVHARALPSTNLSGFGPKRLDWRVYVPKERKYRLKFSFFGKSQTDEYVGPQDVTLSDRSDENEITVSLYRDETMWHLGVYDSRSAFGAPFGTNANETLDVWGTQQYSIMGNELTVRADAADGKLLLFRSERTSQPYGVLDPNATITHGVMIWIEPFDTKEENGEQW